MYEAIKLLTAEIAEEPAAQKESDLSVAIPLCNAVSSVVKVKSLNHRQRFTEEDTEYPKSISFESPERATA